MNAALAWVATSRQKLQQSTLAVEDLDRLEEMLHFPSPRQLVLYLYSKSTNMRSPVASWMLYDATVPQEPVLPSQDPPYESVLAALADGWRVVQFPIAKMYAYESVDNDYLGFEFILEKMAWETIPWR